MELLAQVFNFITLASIPFNVGSGQEQLAAQKAMEAAYIQTGMREEVESLRSYTSEEAKKRARDAGMQRPLAIGIGATQVYRTKRLTIPLQHKQILLTIQPKVAGFSVTIHF
jgi:hypothetical protein